MMQITEQNRPKCEYCKEPAMTYFNNTWVCGACVQKLVEKIKKNQDKIMLEE